MKSKSKQPIVASLVDKDGNSLTKRADGSVYLQLTSESRPRMIGVIKDNCFYVDKDSKKHTFRNTNSYGFNYNILTKSKFEYVCITEDGSNSYRVPKSVILDAGDIMNFKNSSTESFELQIFLNKNTIYNYKI